MARHRHKLRRASTAVGHRVEAGRSSSTAPTGVYSRRSDSRVVGLAAAALGMASLFILGGLVLSDWLGRTHMDGPAALPGADVTASSYDFTPQSLGALLLATPGELKRCDIARLNLLCAEGLPGGEKLDVKACLAMLDSWAEKARFETDRHLYRVRDPRWAEHYRHSESYLRAEFLAQVLQEDCGVHYNEARIFDPDFTNSKDLFVHGMIDCDNGGTCVSMPVLYAAVGRRLGYPLTLVLAKRHVFCRWDDGKGERFNVDPSGNGGIAFEPDGYYRTWPATISEEAIARGEYLKSLTPSEELAVSLEARGHCLFDNGRVVGAREAYAAACRLMPQSLDAKGFLEYAERELIASRARPTAMLDFHHEHLSRGPRTVSRWSWIGFDGSP